MEPGADGLGYELMACWSQAALRFAHTGIVDIACTFAGRADTHSYIMVITGTLRMRGRLMPNVLRICQRLHAPGPSERLR